MAQLLKLKDAGSRWQKAIDTLRKRPQEGIVRDEQDQPVAVVLPMELYEYLQGSGKRTLPSSLRWTKPSRIATRKNFRPGSTRPWKR